MKEGLGHFKKKARNGPHAPPLVFFLYVCLHLCGHVWFDVMSWWNCMPLTTCISYLYHTQRSSVFTCPSCALYSLPPFSIPKESAKGIVYHTKLQPLPLSLSLSPTQFLSFGCTKPSEKKGESPLLWETQKVWEFEYKRFYGKHTQRKVCCAIVVLLLGFCCHSLCDLRSQSYCCWWAEKDFVLWVHSLPKKHTWGSFNTTLWLYLKFSDPFSYFLIVSREM